MTLGPVAEECYAAIERIGRPKSRLKAASRMKKYSNDGAALRARCVQS